MKKRVLLTLALIVSSTVLTLNAQNWNEIINASASDAADTDLFGRSVSIDGDYAIVGSALDDDNGSNSGSAYVFFRSGNTWTEQSKLTATDVASNDQFGRSVSVDGDYAIIGAPNQDNVGNNSGSAYIFMRSGSTWVEQAKLIASDGAALDNFGSSVDIDDDYAIIGAKGDGDLGVLSGSVYVFVRTGSSWVEQTKLVASDGDALDLFGESVSIDGDYVVVGAPNNDDNLVSNTGAAYIFFKSGNNWTEQAKLTASDAASGDVLGSSVAISGDYTIVGADSNDSVFSNSGSAYIFMRSGNNWTEQVKITASDAASGDRFGNSVSIESDYAIVGAYNHDDNSVSNSGSAYIFQRFESNWIEQTKLVASDAATQDQFGESVSIYGNYAIIGAAFADSSGSDSGAIYFFEPYPISLDVENLPDLTAECELIPTAPTANSGTITATADISFPITTQGTTVVTWTYDDGNGNTETQTQNIIINDTTGPNMSFVNPSDAIVESCLAEVIVPSPLAIEGCLTNDYALDFDGVDDVVTVSQTIGSFKTIEFWMFTENGINGSEEFDYLFSFNDSNLKYIGTGNFTSNYTNETLSMVTGFGQIMTTFAIIPPGWNHIAITGNGSSFDQIIINGENKPVVNNGFPAVFEATTTYIGQFPSVTTSRFDGQFDEIRFWNTPRTEQEIADNLEKLIDPTSPNLLAYYGFEDGTGSTVLSDMTSNGANGVLNNMDINTDWVSSTVPVTSVTLTNDFNGTSDASGTYPEGETIVTWTASDAKGNTSTLQQTINAGDTEAPSISFSNPSDASIISCYTNVTITSPLVSDDCAVNTALDFDGFNDFVRVPSPYQNTGGATTEGWLKSSDLTRSLPLFGNIYISRFNNDGKVYAFFDTSSGNGDVPANQSSTSVTDGQWHHIAATNDGLVTKLYIDGQLEVSYADNYVVNPNVVGIGGYQEGNYNMFNGQLDEARFWNRPLSQAEILSSKNQILNGDEPGLVAYYNFENGIGSNALSDVSGNGYDGDLINMDSNTDWITSTAPITMTSLTNDITGTSDASGTYPEGETIVTWTASDANGNTNTLQQTITIGDSQAPEITCSANITVSNDPGECLANVAVPQPIISDNCTNNFSLDFDGNDEYVDLNGSITLPNTFTIEAWVYPTSVTGQKNILSECDDPNTPSDCLGTDYKGVFFRIIDGKLSLAISPDNFSVRAFAYQTNSSIPINSWTHVAAVVNTSTNAVTMYFNGVVQNGSLTFLTGSGAFSASYNPHIGAQQNTFNDVATLHFSGKIDEIRIWDSLLSQVDIQNQYEDTVPGNTMGLISYYDFEDGTNSITLTDRTGSGIDGSLTNMDANTDWEQGPDAFDELTLINDFNGTSDASGIYPVGETEIIWTVTDASNNSSTCTQLVTVTSTECGTIYTYNNGVWSPSDPNGIATAEDDIIIQTGDATFSSSTTADSVTVEAGASLTINASTTLTVTNGLLLESNSASYSSLILDGSVAGTMTYERHVNINGSGTTGSNDLISPPLTGQDFASFAAANPNILNNGSLFLFGPFEKATGTYVNWASTETATLDAGVGYRTGTTDNGTVTFTGTAQNGTITYDIQNAGSNNEEWNLVGNPYPSYLNVQQFLSHDVEGVTNIQLFDAATAAIYGYDGNAQNGWTIYNLANTTASTLITPGQGFFVSADATNTSLYDLEFTPAMRSTGLGDDFIQGRNEQLVYLKLSLSSSNNISSTDFYFNNSASQGLDIGYDAQAFNDTTSNFNLYSHLLQDNDGKAIALQTLNPTSLTNVSIPLGVKANQGEQITFSINESTLPESVNVYLEDVFTNTSTLLNSGDYSIIPTTDLSGTGRFFLRTSEDALSTIGSSFDNLNIFALNNSKEIVVSGVLQETTSLMLYDIQGRKVFATELDKTTHNNRIDVSSLSGGVYVVTIENNAQKKTQKVVLK